MSGFGDSQQVRLAGPAGPSPPHHSVIYLLPNTGPLLLLWTSESGNCNKQREVPAKYYTREGPHHDLVRDCPVHHSREREGCGPVSWRVWTN